MSLIACPCGFIARKDNVNRLMKKCKANSIILDHQRQIAALHSELDSLRQQLRVEKTITITNNNQIININIFGQENSVDPKLVMPLLRRPLESIPKYIQLKHFANGVGNIRIPNVRGNDVQVVEQDLTTGEKRWVRRDRKRTVARMTETDIGDLVDNYNARDYAHWKVWYEASRLGEPGYDMTDSWRSLIKEVELMIINNRQMSEAQTS